MNSKVDAYIGQITQWQRETELLRKIILGCGLTEELKWGKPCYAFKRSNVVIIQEFKEYCALMFFKGALLHETEGVLVKTGENTQVGRQIRFASVEEIIKLEPILKAYIYEAIEVEKAGLKVDVKQDAEHLPISREFQNKLNEHPAFMKAFYALTPGRQRAYIFYFSSAKQAKTREARIEKYVQQILSGKGMSD